MMRKKILAQLLIIVLLISSIPGISVWAEGDNYSGGFKYCIQDDGTACITGYDGTSTILEIPSEIEGHMVTVIGEKAFNECVYLQQVNFPDSLKSIEKDAFFSCTRLSDISFPENLERLGDGTFYDCQSLTSIVIPGMVKDLGEYAFGGCVNLKSVELQEGIEVLPPSFFVHCKELKEVYLPNSLVSIGRRAFEDCGTMANWSLNVPNGVTQIGERAFRNCTRLDNLTLSDSLQSIGYKFLENCLELDYLFIPRQVNDICDGSFSDSKVRTIVVDEQNPYYEMEDGVLYDTARTKIILCKKSEIKNYIAPETITQIYEEAFAGNSEITSIELKDGVVSIGKGAFRNCSALETITIPNTVNNIGQAAFQESNLSTVTIPASLGKIQDLMFASCGNLQEVTIEDGIQEIGIDAFSDCQNLQKITIPNSITSLSEGSFLGTPIIEALDLSNTDRFKIDGNALYDSEETALFLYAQGINEESFEIPDTVTRIEKDAFTGASYMLEYIILPDHLEEIGENALGFGRYPGQNYYSLKSERRILGSKESAGYEYAKQEELSYYFDKPSLNFETVTLQGGESVKLELNGSFDELTFFSSSDSDIATVDADGMITGVSKGNTSVIVSVGGDYFVCRVNVESTVDGFVPSELTSYERVLTETVEPWIANYEQMNPQQSKDYKDYPSIYCYSEEPFYPPIVAWQQGDLDDPKLVEEFGEDLKQFEIYAKKISYELEDSELQSNTLLYSGTTNVDGITGTSSRMEDMKKAIGKRYTSSTVTSTTLSYEVANKFALEKSGIATILEIYAPKGLKKGSYIQAVSHVEDEYEYLLDQGVEFEIIDAGVKEVTYESFPLFVLAGPVKDTVIRRYIQLKIIDGDASSEEEETPEVKPPTEETPEVKPPTEETPEVKPPTEETPVVKPPVVDNSKKDTKKDSDKKPKTGDTMNMGKWIALMAVGLAGIIGSIIFYGKKKKTKK